MLLLLLNLVVVAGQHQLVLVVGPDFLQLVNLKVTNLEPPLKAQVGRAGIFFIVRRSLRLGQRGVAQIGNLKIYLGLSVVLVVPLGAQLVHEVRHVLHNAHSVVKNVDTGLHVDDNLVGGLVVFRIVHGFDQKKIFADGIDGAEKK